MKVALLADVHANLHALQAVLEDVRRQDCEAVWYLGDYLGYAAYPEQVVRLLQAHAGDCIIGNYDQRVLRIAGPRAQWPKPTSPAKLLSFCWSYRQLSAASRELLVSLPETRRNCSGGLRVLMTHAGPGGNEQIIDAATPSAKLRELAAQAKSDVVLFGHTHSRLDRRVAGVRFINPGAAGRPEGGDPRVSYAVLQITNGRLRVVYRSVTYDFAAAAEAIRAAGLPEAFAQMLLQGRKLEAVLEAMGRHPRRLCESRPGRDRLVQAAAAFAESFGHDTKHPQHVTHLALRLFDELQPYHCMGSSARRWLHCAGLLHDIGWIYGRRGHHKATMTMILNAGELPLDGRARAMVALIARYHRRALPKMRHKLFTALSAGDRYRVWMLAAMLRLADGLDESHAARVDDLACEINKRRVKVKVYMREPASEELRAAAKKSDMLRRAFARKVEVKANGQDRK